MILICAACIAPACSSDDSSEPDPQREKESNSPPIREIANASVTQIWDQVERLDPARRRIVVGLDPEALEGPSDRQGFMSKAVETATNELFDEVTGLRDTFTPEPIAIASEAPSGIFVVSVDSIEAISKLVDSPLVRFVEPYELDLNTYDSLSCGADDWSGHDSLRAADSRLPRTTDGPGDLIPYNYYFHGVDRAWARLEKLGGPGAGVNVAVLDTGLSTRQRQFYERYPQGIRSAPLVLNTTEETANDDCSHGTKMASVATAPRDGRSIVGIAWAADLTSIKVTLTPHAGKSNVSAICAGIKHAVHPPDGRAPARVVAMAFGLTYVSPTIAGCIQAAYDTSPNTVFVAAAGSSVTDVIFPANLDCCVIAASMVELSGDNGFRLMGRPLTVAYGPSVDYVSASTTKGIPASGLVGNDSVDKIAHFSWSSAATGTYAGLLALASQYAARIGLGREAMLGVLSSCSRLDAITDFSGEPVENVVGHGITDVYCAVGGTSRIDIAGPPTGMQGSTMVFSAEAPRHPSLDLAAGGFLRYRWTVDGAFASNQSRFSLDTSTVGERRVRLEVEDTLESRVMTAERLIKITPATDQNLVGIRIMGSAQFVADWATFLNGGRHDRVLNINQTLPHGCQVLRALGVLVQSNGAPEVGAEPAESDDAVSHGFSIRRADGADPRDLLVVVHQWHNGFSAVRTRPVYEVRQPAGVDCSVPGVLFDY
jgi:hypothetical protein